MAQRPTHIVFIPAEGKAVVFDRITLDYAMYLDGEVVGYAATEFEAWRRLDEIVYQQLTH